MGLSILSVGIVYFAVSESGAWATGITSAVAAALGMYGRLALGRWRSALQIVAGAAVVSALGGTPRLVGLLLITGLVASELIVRHGHRSATFRVGGWLAFVSCLTSVSGVVAAVAVPPQVALSEAMGATIGGFLSAPLMFALAPLAEGLFGHVTRLTMADWLSYEHPLLRRLAAAAPGTFQHSVNVGVLADAAAGEIQADALLARVGGLYHDVGKINAPEYFIENQHGPNPHDALEPAESARILCAHVGDGVELVTRYGMGERVADFVREHHGTGQMRLLRSKAEATGQSVTDDAYRYPGPRPRSREAGILMIADQLEATARARAPADDAECDAIVRSTIERISAEGQLGDSGLTEPDLVTAARAFSRALQAMYHRRLSYPASGDGTPLPPVVVPGGPRRSAAS
jgi:putative nucleotidyltransferase with HDIG domain